MRVGRFLLRVVRCAAVGVLLCAALLAGSAAASPPKPPANPFAGRGMWIWYVAASGGGDAQSIIATARSEGLRTLTIKAGDGSGVWSQFSPQLVQTLHAVRLQVCAWQYVYGNDPLGEAQVGAAAVRAGADCLVIDAESEYEGKYVQAQTYLGQLRKLIGANFPVALAGFPYVDYHPAFPYSVFLGPGGAQFNTPQMYWADIGTSVDTVYAHTYAYNSLYGRAIAPVGQVFDRPPAGEIVRFRQLSRAYGAPGVSWWDWQQASGRAWTALARPAGSLVGFAADPAVPVIAVGAKGDLVVWAQEHLITAGDTVGVDGNFGATMQLAVEAFQQAHALTVDGIIGPGTWKALLSYAPAPVAWTKPKGRGPQTASTATPPHAARDSILLPVPQSAALPARADEIPPRLGAG